MVRINFPQAVDLLCSFLFHEDVLLFGSRNYGKNSIRLKL